MKPFWQSLPISINDLPSRQLLLQRIAQSIQYGQSILISGDLRTAKTSLLRYLMAKENQFSLFGSPKNRVIFNYIDCQTLPDNTDYLIFWKTALLPIANDKGISDDNLSTFGKIREFISSHIRKGKIFVLVLDEFDVLLSHPKIGNEKFFLGLLRGVGSLIENFSIIISSHYNSYELTRMIWKDGTFAYGSPPMNIYRDLWLDVLPENDIKMALSYVEPAFSPKEVQYIIDVSGGHPHLVDIAASVLCEQNAKDERGFMTASDTILRMAEPYFFDKWKKWDEDTRKAVAAIAILQSPTILKSQNFFEKDLTSALSTFRFELRHLEYAREIDRDSTTEKYVLRQGAMLWWMADVIIQSIRENSNFSEWLLAHKKPDESGSKKTKETMLKTTEVIGRLLEKGASTLIEAYVKSLVNP